MDIIAIGECMIEMFCEGSLADATTFTKTFAGDTVNMLVAASRLGAKTGYVTHVGNDPFKPFLLRSWTEAGIDLTCVTPLDRPNGLYFISLLPGGEREFTYYRAGSAASGLSPDDIDPAYLTRAKIVYASGISQAISASSRAAVLKAFRIAHEHGLTVAYDPNLRLRLWPLDDAKAALDEVIPYVNLMFPSAPDETARLFGTEDAETVIRTLWGRGIKTVVVKQGAAGVLVGAGGTIRAVPAYTPGPVVDTSGAGDAFNGGFLHGLAFGLPPVEAARLGTIIAGLKVRGRGAIYSLPAKDEVERVFNQGRG
ncbi:MAG: sugar kinase [Candidatus Latescibacteria bacterium]|nr:sugar kinase [Candidatus Latescibacterota bacterium]